MSPSISGNMYMREVAPQTIGTVRGKKQTNMFIYVYLYLSDKLKKCENANFKTFRKNFQHIFP